MGSSVNDTNKEPSCKLTMFPANEGDCFLLEFGTGKDAFRMMIDSGTVGFGNHYLKEYLQKHDFKKNEKMIDLLLITHFDRDHIGGALSILRDSDYCGLIKEIWHNGLKQIAPDLPMKTDDASKSTIEELNAKMGYIAEDESQKDKSVEAQRCPVSAKQSETLSKFINQYKIKVNTPQGGRAIVAGIPKVDLGPQKDVEVFFLLPPKEHLDALLDYFKINLGLKVKASQEVECEELFEKISVKNQPASVEVKACAGEDTDILHLEDWLRRYNHLSDTSQTNASSIAIIIRYKKKKLLFPGDAWGQELSDALTKWLSENPEETLEFDVVKLPHHGSCRNCWDLLNTEGFDGKIFLVSTDGEKHGHPHKETLAKIVHRHPEKKKVLAFNYTSHARYGMFADEQTQKKYNYCIEDDQEFPEFEVKENA